MRKEGEVRIPSGCAISGIFDRSGGRMSGEAIIRSISLMHDRSNGLGGGFAGYGIYPEYAEFYAFHVFYDSDKAREDCEEYLHKNFSIIAPGEIPTRLNKGVENAPKIWRYFVSPIPRKQTESLKGEREFVAACVFFINVNIDGAFVFSSGKNMGIFKAVGYPEDVGEFYRLEDYSGYCWTAHGRYPTNTPGWWGGAHPFGLLDYSIVHNGEISSYDANRRCIEMYGYNCSLLTDTEAITYMFDYLLERQHLTLEEAAIVVAGPFWEMIDRMDDDEKAKYTYLRRRFSDFLITGPFSIILGFNGGFMALNDRLKLRSMVAAEKGDKIYVASEESAIRIIEPELDKVWWPKGGEPVIARLKGGAE